MALAGGAMATTSFTTVNAPPAGEKNHKQILSQVYGGTWTAAANGLDYSSSTMTASRLADSGVATPTSLTTGVSGTDNAWTGPAATSVIINAKYAADNSVFGYFDDSGEDTSFHAIFNTSSIGSSATVNLPGSFRWALKDISTGRIWTSHASDNLGTGASANQSFDQLATYKITGSGQDMNQWALFWEDRPYGASDRDFNDAMITIQTCPVPGPATAGLLGLGALGVARRRRTR
jgi:MYXO-CTERM domain-containing protein